MTGFTIQEKHGDTELTYRVHKNGNHSGNVTVQVNGVSVLEDSNFTTVRELMSALSRAEIAGLIRANKDAEALSMGDEGSQHFIKYAMENLKRMVHGSSAEDKQG
jgi:hypothetical protein|tara:strand:+ start:1124 stop:1438 length:315 start_codon:yes stop_codon:yes gene_type:complete